MEINSTVIPNKGHLGEKEGQQNYFTFKFSVYQMVDANR